MTKLHKLFFLVTVTIVTLFILISNNNSHNKYIPLVAIANYGPHISLQTTINGLQQKLSNLGYIENKNIQYEILDVNFDTSLINQMLVKLKSSKPNVIVVISTPVAQAAKNLVKDIPVVFADITDPLGAGLNNTAQNSNITGASDKQDLSLMFELAKKILPHSKKVGVLYSTGEANDTSLVKTLTETAKNFDIEVIAVPVEHARDAATRMNLFKDNVDFIYTGSSAVVQTAFAAIAQKAEIMNIPIFDFDSQEVYNHNSLASYGVSHFEVGSNAALIIDKLLKGTKTENIPIIYPSANDHIALISKKRAEKLGIELPSDLTNIIIVE